VETTVVSPVRPRPIAQQAKRILTDQREDSVAALAGGAKKKAAALNAKLLRIDDIMPSQAGEDNRHGLSF
jgi:hypothetical protein